MKKLNEFLNKSVTRKDLFSNYSVFTLILLFIYAIGFFVTTLGPTIDGNNLTLDLFSLIRRPYEQYHFSATETELYFATIIPFVVFMLQFSFLHKKSSCYTTLSFNINRKNLYRNRLLFPLLFILFVMVAVKLYVLKANVDVYGLQPLLFQTFFAHLFTCIKIVLFAIFCAVFASILCGRTIEAAAAGISIFALPSLVSVFISFTNSFTLYGASEYSETIITRIANALNPIDWSDGYYLYTYYADSISEEYSAIESTIISLAWIISLSVGLFALGKYFEKGYKPEKSGFKGANAITSSFVSITLPLFVTLLLFENIVYSASTVVVSTPVLLKYSLLGILVLIICSLTCNFLVHFTFRKVKFAIIGALATVVFMLALAGINSTDIFNTYNKLPDKNDVAKIEMEFSYDGLLNAGEATGNAFFGMLDRKYDYTVVDNEKEIELVMDFHKAIVDKRDRDTTLHATLSYTLKDGTKKSWEYSFLSEEAVIEAMKFRESEIGEEYLRENLLPDTIVDEETGEAPEIDYWNTSMIISPIPGSTFYPDLNKLSTEEFRLLRETIFEDVMNISNNDWYYPTESPLAYLILNVQIRDGRNYHTTTPFTTPIYPSMKKTLHMLEHLDFHGDMSYETPIEEVYIADLDDMVDYITDSSVTGPIFSSLYPVSFDMKKAPVTRVENEAEWDALFQKAYPYYYVGSEKQGKVLIVKFANSQPTPMALYYIP